jgi:SAM-dependent methyltransferase
MSAARTGTTSHGDATARGYPAPVEDLERLRQDPRNLTNALRLELAWKQGRIREGHFYIRDLLEGGEGARKICSAQVIDYCEQFIAEHGRKPKVLDFACGPISSLAYLVHHDLAELTAVDILGPEYAQLFELHGIESPVPSQWGVGEYLTDQVGTDYDLVHVRNALDHCQVPAVVWLNLFEVTREGGVLCQVHSINEAEKEGYKQLHQFNVYPKDDELWIGERDGFDFCLTAHLPLRRRWFSATQWVASGYEKTGSNADPEYHRYALKQAMRALRERNRWTFELETHIAAENKRLPIAVTPERT